MALDTTMLHMHRVCAARALVNENGMGHGWRAAGNAAPTLAQPAPSVCARVHAVAAVVAMAAQRKRLRTRSAGRSCASGRPAGRRPLPLDCSAADACLHVLQATLAAAPLVSRPCEQRRAPSDSQTPPGCCLHAMAAHGLIQRDELGELEVCRQLRRAGAAPARARRPAAAAAAAGRRRPPPPAHTPAPHLCFAGGVPVWRPAVRGPLAAHHGRSVAGAVLPAG